MPEYLICPQCRAANPPGSQFCAQCGWAPTPPGPPQGQQPDPGQPEFQAPYAYGQSYDQPYGQTYPQQAPAGQPTPYRQPAYGEQSPSRDRRLTLMIVAGALAVVVIAALAVIIVPRVVHQSSPAPAPAPPTQTSASQQPSPVQSPSQTASASPTPASPTPSKAPDYGRLGAQVSSGILEIVSSGCRSAGGSMIGSAFLINNRTAVASLSSLAGADVIAVSNGTDTVTASVAGTDRADGLVIVKLDHAVRGHVFTIDDATPVVGDPVGAYGFSTSVRKPALVMTRVRSVGAAVKVGSSTVGGLAATTATTVDNGVSGAPTLAADGHANGMALLDAHRRMMIIPGKTIKEAIAHPSGKLPTTHCTQRGASETTMSVSGTQSVDDMFEWYFTGINSGDYRTAFDQLSSQLQATGYSNYAKGWATSYDFNIVVHKASGSGAYVTFDSIFAKGKGPSPALTCARWDIDYTFTHEGGKPVINKAEPHSGSIWRKC